MNFRAMIISAALVAGSVATATAADLGRGGSMKDGYAPMPQAAASGPSSWYIRGDVGHARHDDPNMIEDGRWDLSGTSIENTWTLGGGIGYYFSKNVRADITWDHRFEADAHGTAGPFATFPGGTRQFGLKSDVFLANVYYDIDLRSRVTPYIGLGLGIAHNKTTTGSVTDACGGCTGTIAGASERSVAGALMTGFSMQLRDRLHVDAGYRMLFLGDAHTGLITGTGASAGTVAGDPVVQDIWAHEFRVGFRYDIR